MSETNNVQENIEVNGEGEKNIVPAETAPENQGVEGTATENAETSAPTMPEEPHHGNEI